MRSSRFAHRQRRFAWILPIPRPAVVPLDILLKLSVHDEGWYVQAPANAALREIVRSFPDVPNVFYSRLRSAIPEARSHAASHIESVARRDCQLELPPGEAFTTPAQYRDY
jgi:hypothetical protein